MEQLKNYGKFHKKNVFFTESFPNSKMILRFACEAPIKRAWFMFPGTTYGTPTSPILLGPDQSLSAIISQLAKLALVEPSCCDPDSRYIF